MTSKCTNHTLQTNPRYHEEEAQNADSQNGIKTVANFIPSFLDTFWLAPSPPE